MSNYPGPPSWTANTPYVQNQSEVVNANFYYVCATSGTSGNSNPFTAVAAASVFNSTITDGTTSWVVAQRARAAWSAAKPYTAGLPLSTSASTTTGAGGGTLRSVPNAQFIPIGSYVIDTNLVLQATPPYNLVTSVNPAASIVTVNAFSGVSGAGQPMVFNQAPYPWPDQIVTAASVGAPVVQCIRTGVSGGSTPTWSTTLGASVADGSAAWATVGFN